MAWRNRPNGCVLRAGPTSSFAGDARRHRIRHGDTDEDARRATNGRERPGRRDRPVPCGVGQPATPSPDRHAGHARPRRTDRGCRARGARRRRWHLAGAHAVPRRRCHRLLGPAAGEPARHHPASRPGGPRVGARGRRPARRHRRDRAATARRQRWPAGDDAAGPRGRGSGAGRSRDMAGWPAARRRGPRAGVDQHRPEDPRDHAIRIRRSRRGGDRSRPGSGLGSGGGARADHPAHLDADRHQRPATWASRPEPTPRAVAARRLLGDRAHRRSHREHVHPRVSRRRRWWSAS